MRFKDIHLYCRNESYVIHIIWLWVFMVLHNIALVGGDGRDDHEWWDYH